MVGEEGRILVWGGGGTLLIICQSKLSLAQPAFNLSIEDPKSSENVGWFKIFQNNHFRASIDCNADKAC